MDADGLFDRHERLRAIRSEPSPAATHCRKKPAIWCHDADMTARIFVVDDSAAQRAQVRDILAAERDYVVEEYADGMEALVRARIAPPDLVLSDVEMPRLNGLALTRALRSDPRQAHVAIIMLTSQDGERALVAGFEAGVDDYLAKPVAPREVLARVRNVLGLRRALATIEQRNADIVSAMEELRRAQERLVAAQRIAYAGKLAMGLSHECNNALATLRANLGALSEYGTEMLAAVPLVGRSAGIVEIAADLPGLFQDSLAACDHLTSVIARFAAFGDSGIVALAPEAPADLGLVVAKAVADAARAGGAASRSAVATGSMPVAVNADELARHLAALVGHMAHAAGAGARLDVAARVAGGCASIDITYSPAC
jgi:DNA-binding response OmpR family regulator